MSVETTDGSDLRLGALQAKFKSVTGATHKNSPFKIIAQHLEEARWQNKPHIIK